MLDGDGLSILDPSCFTQDTIHSRLVGPRASLDGCGEENISCYHCSLHSKKWHQFYNKTECIKLLQKKISPCTYFITSCSCLVHVPDVYWKCPTNFHLPLNLLLWCIEHKTLGMLVPLYLPLYWTIYGICQFYNKKMWQYSYKQYLQTWVKYFKEYWYIGSMSANWATTK